MRSILKDAFVSFWHYSANISTIAIIWPTSRGSASILYRSFRRQSWRTGMSSHDPLFWGFSDISSKTFWNVLAWYSLPTIQTKRNILVTSFRISRFLFLFSFLSIWQSLLVSKKMLHIQSFTTWIWCFLQCMEYRIFNLQKPTWKISKKEITSYPSASHNYLQLDSKQMFRPVILQILVWTGTNLENCRQNQCLHSADVWNGIGSFWSGSNKASTIQNAILWIWQYHLDDFH